MNKTHQIYSYNILIVLGTVILLTLFAYKPSLYGGFQHDDIVNIVSNEKLKITNLSLDELQAASFSSGSGRLKRPVSMLTFALNYYFFSNEPFSFKLTNLILHILCGATIFALCYKIVTILNSSSDTRNLKQQAFIFASIVSAIWLLHPVQVSTVAYVVQRMAMLSTLFMLISIWFYISARLKHIYKHEGYALPYTFCLVFFALALFSKENGVLLPLILLAIEYLVLRHSKEEKYKLPYSTLLKVIAGVFTLLLTVTFLGDILAFLDHWYARTREFTLEERLFSQPRVVTNYIWWFIFPDIQQLGLFHDDFQISKSLTYPPTTLTSIVLLLVILTLGIIFRNKRPLLSLGIAWFFIAHLLESTIIPLEMVYEHRNYLAYIGLAIILADIILLILDKAVRLKKFITAALITLIVALSITTHTRAQQWSSPLSFAYFEAMHHPNSSRANHVLGMRYRALVLAGEQQYKDDAFKYLSRAAEINSIFIQPEAALLQFSYELNEPAKPEWINRIALKLRTKILRADHINLLKQITKCKEGKCFIPNDASLFLIESAYKNPKITLRPKQHAELLSLRANYYLENNLDIMIAEKNLALAVEIDPNNIQYYADYINLLLILGKNDLAIKYLSQAYDADKSSLHKASLDKLRYIVESQSKNNTE